MQYAFVIDQSRCIGCHACSLACKAEHDVPLGTYRTWVKYVEKGAFPDTRRYFTVLRCNHCELAPCVEICPVNALFRRDDGVVDFDGDACIGCKACMQACPYDALYIHPDEGTAEKCNFCSHRLEIDLEPPCATVCPAEAILVGDLEDPESRVARIVATQEVNVRKPHKGTRPNVFYVDAEPRALVPGASDPSTGYLWAEGGGQTGAVDGTLVSELAPVRTTYDVPHHRPWGWRVSAYLWTKSIAAGAFMVAALAAWFDMPQNVGERVGLPLVGLLFLALTSVLLVADLKRPERFFKIMTRPNWSSWLARGAFILVGFSGLAGLWTLAELARTDVALTWLRWPVVVSAAAGAGYSGYLFAQAKGRDYWQSPILPAHLLVQALITGAAVAILTCLATESPYGHLPALLAGMNGLHLGMILFGEVTITHVSQDGRQAAEALTRGPLRRWFWGAILTSAISAMLALSVGALPPAALFGLIGVLLYEHAWVQAGQIVPLS